jgi:hypothetical protein
VPSDALRNRGDVIPVPLSYLLAAPTQRIGEGGNRGGEAQRLARRDRQL